MSSVSSPFPQGITLQSAVTTGNGTAVDLGSQTKNATLYIEWSAGTSAGAIQLETASSTGYAGTWAPIGSPIAWVAVSTQIIVQITGAFAAVRARVSTTVVGGTVSCRLFAN